MSEDMSETYPAISTSTNVWKESDYSLLEYELPGFGVKHSDRCNEPSFIEYCPDCRHTDIHSYHCNRWDCPVCYPWTANKRARETSNRLWGVLKAWQAAGTDVGFFNHLMMSVPPSEYANFDEKKSAKKVRKYLKEIGVSGGALIFHPFRIKDDIEDIFRQERQAGALKVSNWIAVHHNCLKGPFMDGYIETWRDYIEFAPHWHIVGYFKLKERSDHFYERTGWTYKNISWERYHEALDKDSARRTIAYLCTHHRYQKGRQSVTYFGVAAPNKVTCEITKEMKVAKCPECSQDIKQMDIDGGVAADLSKGDLYRIPVYSSLQAEKLIEDIHCNRFKFKPDDYKKSWYPVVHRFYSVRTDFSRHVKPVEVVEDSRIEKEPDFLKPIPWATEEEIQARKEYEKSLPAIDWDHISRIPAGTNSGRGY